MTAYELWRALLWHVLRGGGRDAIVISASTGHDLRELESVEPQPGWYEVLLQAGPALGEDTTRG